LDETKVEAAITERTRAIVPVHYAGVACEMDSILEIAARHGLLVIEDAAQGVNSLYKGRYLGTIGQLGAYSFHETKNFIAGEGGALVINDERFIERAEIIREKGTNRSKFFRGEVDKYTWVDIGSSYLPSEIVAAFLYAQLEETDLITSRRRAIYQRYLEAFTPLAAEGLVQIPAWPPECQHNAHLFYLILPTATARDGLIAHLRGHDVHAVFHYVPLHSSPMGKGMGYAEGDFPITEDLSARLVRMPFFFDLDEPAQTRVIDVVCNWLGQNGGRRSAGG
jgi:dTDP-4-amino-4,6-dideoxygalactose transaminase